MTQFRIATALVLSSFFAGTVFAQSNTVPGRDVKLGILSTITALGRTGAFPNGVNGLAESTTACNVGTVTIPWEQAMDADHPVIAFLIARERNGRFEQISDRSYVKHGFFALNNSQCNPCQNPGSGSKLGVNCSDTYSTSNNGDNFWLGPTEEIDPWTGLWNPVCSHFDQGEPAVAPPFNCDGVRSLTSGQASALGPVGHRVKVKDGDFNVTGATFYFQAQYTTQGEAENLRGDNVGSRIFIPVWNTPTANKWNLTVPTASNPLVYGSVLQRWSGATVNSATNGADDGRFFVAVKVSGPNAGLYHYEYAVHNRDNARGAASLRIPICPDALFLNASFRDVDGDGATDWSIGKSGSEIEFAAPSATAALGWNTFFNFSFDSDAAPVSGSVHLDAALPGAGLPTVDVASSVPGQLDNIHLGAGCGNPVAPLLFATGSPAKATLPAPSFGLAAMGVAPGSTNFLFLGLVDASLSLSPSCVLYMDLPSAITFGIYLADGAGLVTMPIPIPSNPAFEGLHANFQLVEVQAGTGALFGNYDLSNGLRVRVGNALSACP